MSIVAWIVLLSPWSALLLLILWDVRKRRGAPLPVSQPRHRNSEMRFWRHQLVFNYVSILLSAITIVGAAVACYIAFKAYKETRRAADAAVHQIAIARDTEIRQLRAYVSVRADPARLDNFEVGKKPRFYLALENMGQTPVYDAALKDGGIIVGFPLLGEYPHQFSVCSEVVKHPAASQHFFAKPVYLTREFPPLDQDQFDKIKRGEAMFYYIGKICYKDIFRVMRYTQFCLIWKWDFDTLIPGFCDKGNKADVPE